MSESRKNKRTDRHLEETKEVRNPEDEGTTKRHQVSRTVTSSAATSTEGGGVSVPEIAALKNQVNEWLLRYSRLYIEKKSCETALFLFLTEKLNLAFSYEFCNLEENRDKLVLSNEIFRYARANVLLRFPERMTAAAPTIAARVSAASHATTPHSASSSSTFDIARSLAVTSSSSSASSSPATAAASTSSAAAAVVSHSATPILPMTTRIPLNLLVGGLGTYFAALRELLPAAAPAPIHPPRRAADEEPDAAPLVAPSAPEINPEAITPRFAAARALHPLFLPTEIITDDPKAPPKLDN